MDAFEKQNFTKKSYFTTSVPERPEPSPPFGFKVLCPEVWTSSEETICYSLYKANIALVWKDLLTDIRNQEEIRDALNEDFVELCWSKCF